jgi:hypothetical protein
LLVSEAIQRRAKQTGAAAREGEKNARERAELSRKRGDTISARVHEESADRQAETAQAAEQLLAADRRREGDKLQDQ